MVLGRLRLRHGRNSWSASHLAYQETLLDALVDRKRMLPVHQRTTSGRAYSDYGRDADGITDSSSTASGSNSMLDSADSASSAAADAADAAAEAEADAAAAEAADLQRIQQLIHCVEVRRTAAAKG